MKDLLSWYGKQSKALNKAQKESQYDDLTDLFKCEQKSYFDMIKELLYDYTSDKKKSCYKDGSRK